MRTTASARARAHSLPSMMLLNVAHRHKRRATTPYDSNNHSSSTGREASRPAARV